MALLVGAGIASSAQDDTNSGIPAPFCLDLIQLAINRRLQQRNQIAFKPHHDRLALGIAEPGVELQNLRSVVRDHQPDVNHTGVVNPFFLKASQQGVKDLIEDAAVKLRGHDRRRRVGAHAAGIGPAVAIKNPLMILRRGQR